ncbi:MAG: lipid-A-disaccharide synthase [Lentisphaerae bacterium]|nr:lipid-A-disaccharide synthase [Lentisphaerota bacterium]
MAVDTKRPKIWIFSGEASGDDYGAGLARALKALMPDVELKGMGAEKMRSAGVELMVDSTELGIVGFVEVIKHLPFFIRLLGDMVRRAEAERPDCVVLIDYPGFNLRYAERLHRLGIKVVYYISPQVWAWKAGRIPKIVANVDRMLCIFPFEPKVYSGTSMRTEFVGHPLLESLSPYTSRPESRDENVVVLLPGSRRSEISRLLVPLVRAASIVSKRHPGLRFHLPMRNQAGIEFAKGILEREFVDGPMPSLDFSSGDAREWLRRGIAGIAASGTITVEAAILGCPVVVAYKLNWLTWEFAKRVVKLPSITIANLVTGKTVFEECLQNDANPERLADALEAILPGGSRRDEVLEGMRSCVRELGENWPVSRNVASHVLEVAGFAAGGER